MRASVHHAIQPQALSQMELVVQMEQVGSVVARLHSEDGCMPALAALVKLRPEAVACHAAAVAACAQAQWDDMWDVRVRGHIERRIRVDDLGVLPRRMFPLHLDERSHVGLDL